MINKEKEKEKDKDKDKEQQVESEKLENIKEMGVTNIPEIKNNIQFISIIGEIEGHTISPGDKKSTKYEHIIPLLIAAQQDPKIEGLFIILNTVGGDVEAGLALSELINSIDKPKVSLVLGGGHSIGVPLATSTDYSFIVPTATMTIHPIRTTGLVIGVPQTFRYFQKMQQRIINFVLRTSKISNETLTELMYSTDEIANDVGTILVGEEAVKYKLINEVGGFSQALKKLNDMMESKNK